MSLKPPKKSDLDKSWMKARQDRPKKIQPEYHLIVTEGTETEPAYFGAIRDIINSSYPDKIQLNIHGIGNNTLTFHYSAAYINRRLKAEIGVTAHTYLTITRLQKASRLLVLTERPIQEIAQDCGYSDPSLFYKAFTQYNGQNPSQYRKEHRFRN